MVNTLNETYFDELMLSHRQPARISHADGYVSLDENGDASFYYYLKDHLGNVRSVITPDADGKPQVEQANDYFPFGMSFESKLPYLTKSGSGSNKHKYNGKEEQEMPGKWLDYGFRMYDPALARWHVVDPLAENHFDFTPYNYALNNPLLFIDPFGLDTLNVNSNAEVKKGDVVNTENGSITASSDEAVVTGESSDVKGGIQFTTDNDRGTNNDSRKGDGSSVNIDGILPNVGVKKGARLLEFLRDAINTFFNVNSVVGNKHNSKAGAVNVSSEKENSSNQPQSKVDSSRAVGIRYEQKGYNNTKGSGVRKTTLRDSAKVVKELLQDKNIKVERK